MDEVVGQRWRVLEIMPSYSAMSIYIGSANRCLYIVADMGYTTVKFVLTFPAACSTASPSSKNSTTPMPFCFI